MMLKRLTVVFLLIAALTFTTMPLPASADVKAAQAGSHMQGIPETQAGLDLREIRATVDPRQNLKAVEYPDISNLKKQQKTSGDQNEEITIEDLKAQYEHVEDWFSYTLTPNNDGAEAGVDTYSLLVGPGSVNEPYKSAPSYLQVWHDLPEYQDKITQVTIGEGTNEIVLQAFFNCKSLQSVQMPSSLKTIGYSAFAYCPCLNDVSIPSSVKEIGNSAFYRCGSNPTKISFPSWVDEPLEKARICYDVFGTVDPDSAEGTTNLDQFDESYGKMIEVLNSLDLEGKSDIVKIKRIYDWVIQNVEYDYDALDYRSATDDWGKRRYGYSATVHSALFKHLAICDGYSAVTIMMMNEAGVDCAHASSESMDHAWVIVKVDGKWYAMDPTWDDFGLLDTDYNYFLDTYTRFTTYNDDESWIGHAAHPWPEYAGMFKITYPITDEEYGRVSDGKYDFIVYGEDVYILKYRGTEASPTLPKTVTYGGETYTVNKIFKYAFAGNKRIRTLTIPEGYVAVGMFAFSESHNITKISLPSTLKYVGMFAFPYFDNTPTITYNGTSAEFLQIQPPNNDLFEYEVICTDGKVKCPQNLEFAKVKLSKSKFVYNGKIQFPSLTVTANDGTVLTMDKDYFVDAINEDEIDEIKTIKPDEYFVQLSAVYESDYFGAVTFSFKIIPQATKIKKVTAGKKSMTVRWEKKTKQISGYQIQYARNSKFTKSKKTITIKSKKTTSKKIKKLKAGKTYYVRVRTFKNGEFYEGKLYSSWSKAKKVKVKR